MWLQKSLSLNRAGYYTTVPPTVNSSFAQSFFTLSGIFHLSAKIPNLHEIFKGLHTTSRASICIVLRPTILCVMNEFIDDRRQEPRFSISGAFQIELSGANDFRGKIFDLSLNGATLERPPQISFQRGERYVVTLHFADRPPFTAESLIVHLENQRIGVEFYDMNQTSFGILAGLIDMRQSSR